MDIDVKALSKIYKNSYLRYKQVCLDNAKAAYSLLEVLVTLAIVTILMVMLTNTLLLSLDISRKSLARSNLREEQNDILNKISKDIRNAKFVETCSGVNENAKCEVLLDRRYTWTLCEDDEENVSLICKKVGGADEDQILERSNERMVVKTFSIEEGIVETDGKKTIVVTLIVNYNSDTIDIEDQIRQVVISTRNYSV
ncbi:prepilin-type N-terminal cleavage/methylation domain-containing protein [Candidatus Dojkabacteria bacterium]|nr:prepilin-type N-terminal cleavage/methylation domain-containing protein [Candidatus Dojkabacteria bacterium]